MRNPYRPFGGNRHGLSLRTQAILAMYASQGIKVILVDSIKNEAEENIRRLKLVCDEMKASVKGADFMPRTTAYERRNPNQQWWRRFSKNRKRQ